MNKQELIYIGEIIGTFGIKGELKVFSESDFIDYRFRKGALVKIGSKKEKLEFEITSMRIHKNNVLITINNWNDINLVEKYVGSKVYADAADEPPLLEEEYEADALIGLEVLDEKNNNIGVVKDFIEVPQGYIMEIDDGKQGILIPFVDEFIIDVNDENIVVKVLEKCQ